MASSRARNYSVDGLEQREFDDIDSTLKKIDIEMKQRATKKEAKKGTRKEDKEIDGQVSELLKCILGWARRPLPSPREDTALPQLTSEARLLMRKIYALTGKILEEQAMTKPPKSTSESDSEALMVASEVTKAARQSTVLDKMADELVALTTKLATLMRGDVVAPDEAWEPLSEDELEAEEDYNEDELLQQYPNEDWIYPSPEETARMEREEIERKAKQEENDDEDTLPLLEWPYPIESQDGPNTERGETEENGDGGTEEDGDGGTEGHDLLDTESGQTRKHGESDLDDSDVDEGSID